MSNIRTQKIGLGIDLFRCVFLALTMCTFFSAYRHYTAYLESLIIPWGYCLLALDLLYKRRVLKTRQSWILIAITALCGLSILINNEYLPANFASYRFWVLYLLLICPADIPSSKDDIRDKIKAVFAFTIIFLIPVTNLTLQSLSAQINQTGYYTANGVWYGFARWGRLYGFYRNANTAGVVSFISVALLITNLTYIKYLFTSKKIIIPVKVIIIALIIIHFTMLILTSSRASLVSMLLFVLLISFFFMLRYLNKKHTMKKSVILATLAAILITGATYLTDKPVRYTVAAIQAAAGAEHINTDAERDLEISPKLPSLSIIGIPDTQTVLPDAPALDVVDIERQLIDDAVYERFAYWRYGYEIIKKHPLFGVTHAGTIPAVREIYDNKPEDIRESEAFIMRVNSGRLHNSYIQLAVTSGLPVLLLFILFLLLYAWDNIKALIASLNKEIYPAAAAALSLCAALALWNFFESHIFAGNLYTAIVFWSFLSYGATLLNDTQTQTQAKAHNAYLSFKRTADMLISLIAIIILSPVFLALSLAVKLDSPGPVFFTQKRVGINKSNFNMLKFRTMRIDTPKDIPTHKLENPEQYITKAGRFLRKTSLDELPQVLHILSGKMSIVGPRPALWNQDDLVAERDKYGANDVRPGLTGWAQINGRDELPIPVKAGLDGYYVQNIGFLMDCKCFFGTFRSVVKSEGVVEGGTSTLGIDDDKELM